MVISLIIGSSIVYKQESIQAKRVENNGSKAFTNTVERNNIYPTIIPNPVGTNGTVKVIANYSSDVPLATVLVELRGPNLGSSNFSLAPPIAGSLPLSLVSGSVQDGTWIGTFAFPPDLPDGNYLYSVISSDISGKLTTDGPFSGIIINRHSSEQKDLETRIISGIDGGRNNVPNNGISFSTNMTFSFEGTDKTGVVESFECNLDDIIADRDEHDHDEDGGEIDNVTADAYSTCLIPDTIAQKVRGSHNYDNLGLGNHTFKIRVIDNERDVDETPATFKWNILSPT